MYTSIQTSCGHTLHSLEARWRDLIFKNLEIEVCTTTTIEHSVIPSDVLMPYHILFRMTGCMCKFGARDCRPKTSTKTITTTRTTTTTTTISIIIITTTRII